MSLIGLGLGLAKFVPEIIDWFDGDENKASKTAEKLVQVAEKVTGFEGENALSALEQNPELALKFRQQATNDKYFKESLDAKDRANARDMYKSTGNEQANEIAKKIINYNLYFVILIAITQIGVLAYFTELDTSIVVVIGNVCGWIIKGLLDERLQVCNFFFGSSLGSKHKDTK